MDATFYVLLIAPLTLLVYQRWRRMTILNRNGIPGPRPNWIFGNAVEVKKKGMSQCFQEWQKIYGDVVGFYIGGIPHVVITDVDLVKRIQVNDFANFENKDHFLKGGPEGSTISVTNAFLSDGENWHRQRRVLNSNFTPSKLKGYLESIKICVDKKMDHFATIVGGEVEMLEEWESLTMANGGSALLGFSASSGSISKFAKLLREVMESNPLSNFGFMYILFPELTSIFFPLRRWLSNFEVRRQWSPIGKILAILTPMVESRRDSNAKGNFENEKHFLSRLVDEPSFSDADIIGNCLAAITAAQDTTAGTLSYATHLLANDLELQEQVRDEVRGLIARDGELNENVLSSLPLLSAFIYETLRLYPSGALAVTRRPKTDYLFEDSKGHQLTLPAECGLIVGTLVLHKDERHWERPEEFDVNRFADGVKAIKEPFAYQAFGQGPRQCVGMRFALIAAKLAISELLMKFRIVPSPKTEKILTTGELHFTLAPVNGVHVKLVAV